MEQRLHFIGIGGIGMSAIARIMLHQNFTISGSDVQISPLVNRLIELGASVAEGHAPEHIPADCQAVVYSSAVKPDNPELIEAARRGLPIYRRAEMLAFLMSQQRGIGVAGAHGKTTCSAMIATLLANNDLSPTVVVGGRMLSLGNSNALPGDGEFIVAEADESDGTFLMLKPEIAVVTNIEAEHLDHYHDLEHIITAFRQYMAQVPPQGLVVACNDCPITRDLAGQCGKNVVTYGLHTAADYTVKNITHLPQSAGGGILADVFYHGALLGRLQLQVGGEHNVANALAAIAVGRHIGLSFAQCVNGLAAFRGTGRRFEALGHIGQLRIIDDYAHHPTEIAATRKSARDQGAKHIYAVFQPHRYSRTQAMYRQFAESLLGSDDILLVEIYPAFEQPIFGVSAQLVVDALHELGHQRVSLAPDVDSALDMMDKQLNGSDLLLVMGAGNVRAVGERFLARHEEGR